MGSHSQGLDRNERYLVEPGGRDDSVLELRGCIELTRLRLHDILLWTHATGRWHAAVQRGRPLIG